LSSLPISAKTIIQHELIGLDVEILESTNKNQIGIKGLVVDETKNLISIETSKGIKRVQKKGATFLFVLPNQERVKVLGDRLIARPEERPKLKVRKW